MASKASFFIGLAAAIVVGLSLPAGAETTSGAQQAEQLQKAVDAMQKVLVRGPAEVALIDQARLRLPAGVAFVRQPEAGAWAAASGYDVDKDRIGIVTPMVEGVNWVIFVDYHAGAHVSDVDAANWSNDDLLESLRTSTRQGNPDRVKRGLPALEVTGWLEKPAYDARAHRLIWAARTSGADDGDDGGSANVHGYVLGRDGYVEMTMVAPADEVAAYIPSAGSVLAGIAFDAGRRYEDHTDSAAGDRSIISLISATAPGPFAQIFRVMALTWPFLLLAVCIAAIVVLRARRRSRRRSER